MKVIEKGTDRKAEVNIFVEGQLSALEEYGEYIDPRDNAICAYVVLDEGHKPRVGGRFTGTTLAVAYDTIVDGVLRKACSYVAKVVTLQNKRKIDTEKFLCKIKNGIIDTDITVAPLEDVVMVQGDGPETIGTIEHRLYITREWGVSHDIGNMKKYYAIGDNVEDERAGDTEQKVTYKRIPPSHRMSLEKNTAPLEGNQPSLHQRKADAKRPGSEPWAIFRFHYRSQVEIDGQNMVKTFNPHSKAMTDPHTLALSPLPPLILGKKPPSKNDGDTSSRSASPMPPGTPLIPAKSAQAAPKIIDPTKKKYVPKSRSIDTTNMTSPTDRAQVSTSEASPVTSPESTTKVPSQQPTTDAKQAIANGEANSSISAFITAGGGEKATGVANMPFAPARDVLTKVPGLPGSTTKTTNALPETSVTEAKDTISKSPQSPITPAKKPPQSPVGIATTNTTPIAVAPAKRSSSTTNGATPESKRTKLTPTPLSPSTQPVVSQTPPRSSTPKTVSIERQLADQQKKLEEMRKKRKETARKQAEVDVQLVPYKQRMAEALDRLKREMMEEESAYSEEAEHYSASVEILRGFKKTDSAK